MSEKRQMTVKMPKDGSSRGKRKERSGAVMWMES